MYLALVRFTFLGKAFGAWGNGPALLIMALSQRTPECKSANVKRRVRIAVLRRLQIYLAGDVSCVRYISFLQSLP
jgi:hypothetical protein